MVLDSRAQKLPMHPNSNRKITGGYSKTLGLSCEQRGASLTLSQAIQVGVLSLMGQCVGATIVLSCLTHIQFHLR